MPIFGPLIWSADPTALHLDASLLPPSLAHPFGTDNLGRDVLLRIINGASIDLADRPLHGAAGAHHRQRWWAGSPAITARWPTLAVMRLVDIVVAFPFFVLVIAIIAVLGPGLFNMYIAVGLVGWVSYARVVRAEMMVAKQMDYTRAARVLGFSDARILLRHLLPNVIVQALIYSTSDFILGILLGSSLGFLGLGAQPPAPEWGVMIADGYSFLARAPWISTLPGLVIVALAAAFSLFGDGLADYLRPEIDRSTSRRRTQEEPPHPACEDLAVSYRRGGRELDVVNGVSFDVRPGEIFGLVGESGSGKSTVIRSLIQLLPANATIGGGEVIFARPSPCSVSGSGRCSRIRGRDISMVFQDPLNSLNPVMTIGRADRRNAEGRRRPRPIAPRARAGGHAPGPHPRSRCASTAPIPTSSRAVCASAWRSPSPWSPRPGCCWPTSRRRRSTSRFRTRS